MIWLQYTIQSLLASLGMTLAIIFAISPFVHAASMLLFAISAVLLLVSYAIFPHLAFEQLRTEVTYTSDVLAELAILFELLRSIISVVCWCAAIYLGVSNGMTWTVDTAKQPFIAWLLAYIIYPASYVRRKHDDPWWSFHIDLVAILDRLFHILALPITIPLRALHVIRGWFD